MKEFLINERNKALCDSNFVNVDGRDDVQSCGDDGVHKKAEPLNNDPTIQEYGAIVEITKQGYLHKDYKIFNPASKDPICFICSVKENPEVFSFCDEFD